MQTELFISGEGFTPQVLADTLCQHGVNSNIYTTTSVVFDKAKKENKIEPGAKVEIFEADEGRLFNVYNGLVETMGINCIWVNQGEFNGCITTMPGYTEHCKQHGHAVRSCSMY